MQLNRPDELARIESLGGHVIYSNGGPRVGGVLAMSRAIGAKNLKPFVISDPEVSFTRRDSRDEFLIIASDGLFDVVSNDLACEVARRCFQDETPPFFADVNDPYGQPCTPDDAQTSQATLRPSASASVAATLARLALARNSNDNISVIVVDLSTASFATR